MYRSERLVVRLSKIERQAVARLAKAERLPASTLARKMLLDKAEHRGLMANPIEHGQEVQDD